jgi:hypothetical protein
MSRLLISLCVIFVLLTIIANGQRHKVILHPPAPAEGAQTTSTPGRAQKPHFDGLQAEREARELSDLAKTIPGDMDQVNHGLMPKDMLDKLKRIEKLSKHLRNEIHVQ